MELLTQLVNIEKTPTFVVIVISICVVILETVALLKFVLPIWFKKKDNTGYKEKIEDIKRSHSLCKNDRGILEEIERLLCVDTEKDIQRQIDINKRLEVFENNLTIVKDDVENLASMIADYEELTINTFENRLFNENVPVFRRLKAFRRLIALGKNGRVKAKGFALILNNKETWLDVLDTELCVTIVNKEYFDKVLHEISVSIYNGFMA